MDCELRLSRRTDGWTALLIEAGQPVELRLADDDALGVGDRFLAQVQRKLPKLQAAFVDLGDAGVGYLEAADLTGPIPVADRYAKLHEGDRLLVQLKRPARGDKQPRVSAKLEFSDASLAWQPFGDRRRVSKRIEDEVERKRLQHWARQQGSGTIVVRTRAAGQDEAALTRALQRLHAQHERCRDAAQKLTEPGRIGTAPSGLQRLAREFSGLHPTRVLYTDAPELDVWRREAGERRVELPGGGSIVIEPTEALIAIDVNTGARSALEANLEAAEAIAREIRWRDLAGAIVIDFVDMDLREDRLRVERRLRDALQRDRRTHRIAGWTALDHLELSRQRDSASWLER